MEVRQQAGADSVPLMDEMDFGSPPPPPDEPKSWCYRWGVTLVSGTLAATSLTLRILKISPFVNAASSLGLGYGLQTLATSVCSPETVSHIHRVAGSTFGQMALFAFTSIYENATDTATQAVADAAVIVILGINLAIYTKELWNNRAVRIESSIRSSAGEEKFENIYSKRVHSYAAKVLACAAFTVSIFLIHDEMWRGICTFGSTFYGLQVLGEVSSRLINRKITLEEKPDSADELSNAKGSNWRTLKLLINTIALIAIPLAFIPFTKDAHTAARVAQLPFVGGVAGFFDGFLFNSVEDRLREVPIAKITELKNMDAPQNIVYRIWEVAWPIIVTLKLTGFVAWQIGWDLGDDNIDKGAIGAMLGCFYASMAFSWVADRWEPSAPSLGLPPLKGWGGWLKDKMICMLIAPRFFGMNPVYPFFVGTNIAMMNDRAMANQPRDYQIFNINIWGAYGLAMGLEFYRTWTRRKISVFTLPLLVVVNGVLTLKRVAAGAIP